MISCFSGRRIFAVGIHSGDCLGCLVGFDTVVLQVDIAILVEYATCILSET